MGLKIGDGTGGGFEAQVTDDFRLETQARTLENQVAEAFGGNSYNINTGTVTLTNATETPVIYLANTGTTDLVISALFYLLGTSSGGSGEWTIDVVRNPTGGTTISNGNAVGMNGNRDFGSNNTLSANAYKGATGETMTGGTDIISSIVSGPTRAVVSVGAIILRPGNSIGVKATPPTGNTSVATQWALSLYESKLTT